MATFTFLEEMRSSRSLDQLVKTASRWPIPKMCARLLG
jgi:hypothetical protein